MGPTVITMLMLETVMKMRTVCSTCSCGILLVGNGMLCAPCGAMCEVSSYTATLHQESRTAEHILSTECDQKAV